jgi:hypothetical protein
VKIKFIDGFPGYRGAMVAPINGSEPVCGQVWTHRYTNEKGITVVRQRSRWFTALIFVHELAHHINNKLFKHETRGRINIWIDKYMIRKIDKRR